MDKVIVGLDSSPRAATVLAAAVDLARRYGAELIAVHGVGLPLDLPADALRIRPDDLTTELQAASQARLLQQLASLPPGVAVESEVRVGVPWQAICEVAKREKARFVVVGSHGHGAIDRLLGTTATRVVNHAECSVLVVRC